jgi:hypothetical protein
VVGLRGAAGWAPTSHIRRANGEVRALLGDSFAELIET